MSLSPRYDAAQTERRLQDTWARERTYEYRADDPRPTFAIDTPPPTVSGDLTIGHVYSYVQAEAMARFWRMQGLNVFYPLGFDDNGLPTERYVERMRGIRARDVGRAAFIEACLETSREVEDRFEALLRSLGFSVDWRLRYSSIDATARRVSQWSFLDMHRQGRAYRAHAPGLWCVECQTAIAQAEVDDAERATTFYTLEFALDAARGAAAEPYQRTNEPGGAAAPPSIPIATTRPELLPACVAVFVHPDDARYRDLIGREATVPLIGRRVPILADPAADPQKGTGAVMCCTFGDSADVAWWRAHRLPLIPLVTREGRLGEHGGAYAGLTLRAARERIVADLRAAGALAGERPAEQTVRVHERCKTPLEILETPQWFIRLLDAKAELLEAGRRIEWRPAHMQSRYEHWVQNLTWDWCISRQRFFGVPFPAWHCAACGATVLADEAQLPVDPLVDPPPRACVCGSADLRPDEDVMDTWATSSLTPQIAALRLREALGEPAPAIPALAEGLPMQLRPQGHDIIRTWAFYTIAKSLLHFGRLPWETALISGHALDPSGRSIHKSLGNSPIAPAALLERHGADALRYWACGGAAGSDQPLSEERMRQGTRLINKLWSAARFLEQHSPAGGAQHPAPGVQHPEPEASAAEAADGSWFLGLGSHELAPIDRAMRSWLGRLVERVSAHYRAYEYPLALEAAERFFWGTLCDNYLELIKGRLYDGAPAEREAARATLALALETALKLLAPVLPHVTEELYQALFAEGRGSIHVSDWPLADALPPDPASEQAGEAILAIAAAARRHKTARRLGMGTALAGLRVAAADAGLCVALGASAEDLRSVTRARAVTVADAPPPEAEELLPGVWAAIEPA